MTFLLFYLGGVATVLFLNYAIHKPSKELDEKLNQLEESLYRNSGH